MAIRGWAYGAAATAILVCGALWIESLAGLDLNFMILVKATLSFLIAAWMSAFATIVAALVSAPWAIGLGIIVVLLLQQQSRLSKFAVILLTTGLAALAGVLIELAGPPRFWVPQSAWLSPIFGLTLGWSYIRKRNG